MKKKIIAAALAAAVLLAAGGLLFGLHRIGETTISAGPEPAGGRADRKAVYCH